MPSKQLDLQGMPMTGRVVLAAMAPARWAAMPAAAIVEQFVEVGIALLASNAENGKTRQKDGRTGKIPVAAMRKRQNDAAPVCLREHVAQMPDALRILRNLTGKRFFVEPADAQHVDQIQHEISKGQPRLPAKRLFRYLRTKHEPQPPERFAPARSHEPIGDQPEPDGNTLRDRMRQDAEKRLAAEEKNVFDAIPDGMGGCWHGRTKSR